MKKIISASKLQVVLLEEFYKAWEMRPGPNDYFPAQQVWDKVYKDFGSKIDGPLAEGVFNDLLKHEFIKALETNDGNITARLTSSGREYLISIRDRIRTRRIAILGAITGSLGLLLALAKILLDIVTK